MRKKEIKSKDFLFHTHTHTHYTLHTLPHLRFVFTDHTQTRKSLHAAYFLIKESNLCQTWGVVKFPNSGKLAQALRPGGRSLLRQIRTRQTHHKKKFECTRALCCHHRRESPCPKSQTQLQYCKGHSQRAVSAQRFLCVCVCVCVWCVLGLLCVEEEQNDRSVTNTNFSSNLLGPLVVVTINPSHTHTHTHTIPLKFELANSTTKMITAACCMVLCEIFFVLYCIVLCYVVFGWWLLLLCLNNWPQHTVFRGISMRARDWVRNEHQRLQSSVGCGLCVDTKPQRGPIEICVLVNCSGQTKGLHTGGGGVFVANKIFPFLLELLKRGLIT